MLDIDIARCGASHCGLEKEKCADLNRPAPLTLNKSGVYVTGEKTMVIEGNKFTISWRDRHCFRETEIDKIRLVRSILHVPRAHFSATTPQNSVTLFLYLPALPLSSLSSDCSFVNSHVPLSPGSASCSPTVATFPEGCYINVTCCCYKCERVLARRDNSKNTQERESLNFNSPSRRRDQTIVLNCTSNVSMLIDCTPYLFWLT